MGDFRVPPALIPPEHIPNLPGNARKGGKQLPIGEEIQGGPPSDEIAEGAHMLAAGQVGDFGERVRKSLDQRFSRPRIFKHVANDPRRFDAVVADEVGDNAFAQIRLASLPSEG